jgi:hypothetical protein
MMNKECRMMKERIVYNHFDIRHSLFDIHHFFSFFYHNLLCQYK